jgi:hypothetical protein
MQMPETITIAAVAVVSTLGIIRLYSGGYFLHPKFMTVWGLLRRLFMPLLDQYAKRTVGISVENKARRGEFVHDIDSTPVEVRDALVKQSGERWETSVLSGLKTDWADNTEVASLVCYQGSKPVPGAPDWLRHDQIHVFLFSAGVGTRVCAHKEANSWRPDLWRDHLYKGPSFSAKAGVDKVEEWLQASALSVPVTDPQQ